MCWTNTGKGPLLCKGDPDLSLSSSPGSRARDQAGGTHHSKRAERCLRGTELPTPPLRLTPREPTERGPRNTHRTEVAPPLGPGPTGTRAQEAREGWGSSQQRRAGAPEAAEAQPDSQAPAD